MVTLDAKGLEKVTGSCLSGDTKPTNVGNGSILLEIDTGKVWAYDAENQTWYDITK